VAIAYRARSRFIRNDFDQRKSFPVTEKHTIGFG